MLTGATQLILIPLDIHSNARLIVRLWTPARAADVCLRRILITYLLKHTSINHAELIRWYKLKTRIWHKNTFKNTCWRKTKRHTHTCTQKGRSLNQNRQIQIDIIWQTQSVIQIQRDRSSSWQTWIDRWTHIQTGSYPTRQIDKYTYTQTNSQTNNLKL